MGTTRDSKAGAKTSARGASTAKKKTTKKAAQAKAAAPKKPPRASAAKAAAKAVTKSAAKAPAAKRALRDAESKAPRPAHTTPRTAKPAAELRPSAAKPPALAAPPPPPVAARDPREERRARLEEKLALRSATLREQAQQRSAPPSPPRREFQQAPAGIAAPPPPAPRPRQDFQDAPRHRPDLPFDPGSFSPAGPRPAQAAAPAAAPAAGAAEEPGRRRRRRRRRRGGGADGAWAEGEPRRAEVAAPAPARPAPQQQQQQHASEDFEGGGRRRRRRRRRRSGSGDAPAPPQAQRPAFERPSQPFSRQRPRDEDDHGFGGGPRRGKQRRDHGFSGPVPWDPEREAPAINILPDRDSFSELVSIDPEERIDLETDTEEMSMRVVDLVTPIGKGQRALIVAPPKTGKTTLLMQLARAISENHPEIELIVMLVDERPEEVTAFRRAGYGEVLASSNDEPTHRHLKLTQYVHDIAKRRVMEGKDVCILLDSITRMARAHNVASAGNKTLSGGLDSRALERPKRFFGAARKIAGGGSLTILATALIDTGSRMDEVVFQEFKGTGNSELQLDRRLAERRIWPAIDIQKSGTRKEEKLFEPAEFEGVVALRRALSGKPPAEAMQMLLSRLAQYRTNREFLLDVARKAAAAL